MLDLRDAHSLDTVPGSARYTRAGEADNTELIEGEPSSGLAGSKATQTMGTIQGRAPGQKGEPLCDMKDKLAADAIGAQPTMHLF